MSVFIYPILLIVLLLWGASRISRGEWNDDYISLKNIKAIQGFSAIGIVFHHMAQKTCAPWLEQNYIVHGLDAFLYVGYLLVGIFLFSSGYGLYKSFKEKENYLDRFISRKFWPIIFVWLISVIVFYIYGNVTNPYAWYVFAILYLYLCFFIGFRYCKKEWQAITIIILGIILYSYVCDWLILGGWWYNTVGLFVVGMIWAKNEQNILAFIKSKYVAVSITSIVMLSMTFAFAIILNNRLISIETPIAYTISRVGVVALQFISALCFSVGSLLLLLKVNIGNKVLNFVGNITLEIYLIHGFFVNLFASHFVNESIKSLVYIKVIPIYVIVVLVAGVLSAYGLTYVEKGMMFLTTKFKDVVSSMKMDVRKIIFGLILAFVAITFITKLMDSSTETERQKMVDAYEKENIQYVNVNGKKMAAYVAGQGEDTIVVMRGMYDPCPTMTMKALADSLSDNFRVVVLDYFGSGFSDDTDEERTAQNIANEIHTAIKEIGVEGQVILMPEFISGLYAQYYVSEYPGEVKAVVAVDANLTSIQRELLSKMNYSLLDLKRMNKRDSVLNGVTMKFLNATGYKIIPWRMYEIIYAKGFGKTKTDIPYQVVFEKMYNKLARNEMCNEYDSYLLVENMKYPSDIKVIDIYSHGANKAYLEYGIDLKKHYDNSCESGNNHVDVIVVDSLYCLCYNPGSIKKIVLDNL